MILRNLCLKELRDIGILFYKYSLIKFRKILLSFFDKLKIIK